MSEFDTWVILLINQLDDIGEMLTFLNLWPKQMTWSGTVHWSEHENGLIFLYFDNYDDFKFHTHVKIVDVLTNCLQVVLW